MTTTKLDPRAGSSGRTDVDAATPASQQPPREPIGKSRSRFWHGLEAVALATGIARNSAADSRRARHLRKLVARTIDSPGGDGHDRMRAAANLMASSRQVGNVDPHVEYDGVALATQALKAGGSGKELREMIDKLPTFRLADHCAKLNAEDATLELQHLRTTGQITKDLARALLMQGATPTQADVRDAVEREHPDVELLFKLLQHRKSDPHVEVRIDLTKPEEPWNMKALLDFGPAELEPHMRLPLLDLLMAHPDFDANRVTEPGNRRYIAHRQDPNFSAEESLLLELELPSPDPVNLRARLEQLAEARAHPISLLQQLIDEADYRSLGELIKAGLNTQVQWNGRTLKQHLLHRKTLDGLDERLTEQHRGKRAEKLDWMASVVAQTGG